MANLQSNDYYSGNKISILIIYALSYALGILFFLFFDDFFFNIVGISSFLLLFLFLKHHSLHQTITLICLFLIIGYINTSLHTPNHNHLLTTYQDEGTILGKINSAIQRTSKGYYKFTIASEELVVNSERTKCNGNILVYTKAEPSSARYNDYIILNKEIKLVQPPQNPNEFNFKRYLNFHHIHFSTFCASDDFITIPNPSFSIIKIAHQTQDKLSNYLLSEISSPREAQTISALVLGKRDELNKEVIANYSAAGAMHVLAVSGLHVGILLLIIRFVFQQLLKNLFPKWLELIGTLLLIWSFAFITGLSASVVRAACMFSFIICGMHYKKDISIYPILAASALCMMLYNPYIITEVGFQLSYAAVIGIVFFTPQLQVMLPTSQYWLINKISAITGVSISAQLATAPIAILYFHQFPTYFILSNLVVIPCAFLIVITGIVKLIVGSISLLNSIIAKVLCGFSWFLNEVSEKTAGLPSATINQIDISILETYLFYGAIITFFLVFINRSHQYLKPSLLLVLLISISMIFEHSLRAQQRQLVIYNIKRETAFDIINGKEHLFKASAALLKNEEKLQFHIKHHWYHKNLKPAIIDSTTSPIRKYSFANQCIVHVSKQVTLNTPIDTDYLIISNNSMKLNEAIKNFNYKKLIYDSSNSNEFVSYIRNSPLYTDSVYIVSEQGSIISQF